MNRLEHARITPLRVNVAGGRDAQAARQRSRQVAQDVGVQIGGNQRVEGGGAIDHARRRRIHQFLVPFHVRKFSRYLQRNFIPHHHGVTLRIGLGDHRQQLAWA